jgi:two-component system nitrate/nitrite response regulator NarL
MRRAESGDLSDVLRKRLREAEPELDVTVRQCPTAEAPARVLVADPRPRWRRWIRAAVEDDPRFVICAETADAAETIEEAVRTVPDVCVLDLRIPGGGHAAVWEIAARLPRVRIVILTASKEPRDFLTALRAGASSYLLKGMNPGRLVPVFLDVVQGKPAIPRELVALLVDEFRDLGPRRRRIVSALTGRRLTSREWQVVDLVCAGLSTSEIAKRLGVSNATVRSHVSRALRKLHVDDRQAAMRQFPRR